MPVSEVDSLVDLFEALTRPGALIELGVLIGVIGLAWAASRLLRPADSGNGIVFGKRGFDGVLFPLLALLLALLARQLLKSHVPIAVLRLAIPMLASLAVIRIAVRVLREAYPESRLVRVLERTFSWLVWLAMVLWVTGLLPILLDEMSTVSWTIAGAAVSLRSLLEGLLSAAAVLVLALWLSATVEARLLRSSRVSSSVRKMAANATRAGLLLFGVLVALSAAGIPLGALGVVGGAVGVGIGFGLQKLASNYVSGFVILAERSLRIGDVVKVDGFEGRITDIKTRFTVIRALSGREAIVPNELLITQRVESNTLADSQVSLSTEVQVAYGTDLDALIPQLLAVIGTVARVLEVPAPGVQLTGFGADGLSLKMLFWIADSENGTGNVTSDVNLAVLKTLNAAGVEIPYPQRVVHGLPPAAVQSAPSASSAQSAPSAPSAPSGPSGPSGPSAQSAQSAQSAATGGAEGRAVAEGTPGDAAKSGSSGKTASSG